MGKIDVITYKYVINNVFDIILINNFQYRSQFADTENMTRLDHRKHVQMTSNTQSTLKCDIFIKL